MGRHHADPSCANSVSTYSCLFYLWLWSSVFRTMPYVLSEVSFLLSCYKTLSQIAHFVCTYVMDLLIAHGFNYSKAFLVFLRSIL